MTADLREGGEVTLALAVELCETLHRAGVKYWVAGGWGVDALVGNQTRPHRDLDLLVDARDEGLALQTLARLGYVVETDWLPVRVEVAAPGRGYADVHPVVFDAEGTGRQAGLDGAVFVYPPSVFTSSSIGGHRVGCLTVQHQLHVHSGYAPRPQGEHDVTLLRRLQAGVEGPAGGSLRGSVRGPVGGSVGGSVRGSVGGR